MSTMVFTKLSRDCHLSEAEFTGYVLLDFIGLVVE